MSRRALIGLVAAIALPIPLLSASGLSLPLPSFVKKMAYALVPGGTVTVASTDQSSMRGVTIVMTSREAQGSVSAAHPPIAVDAHVLRTKSVHRRPAAAVSMATAPAGTLGRPAIGAPANLPGNASKAVTTIAGTAPASPTLGGASDGASGTGSTEPDGKSGSSNAGGNRGSTKPDGKSGSSNAGGNRGSTKPSGKSGSSNAGGNRGSTKPSGKSDAGGDTGSTKPSGKSDAGGDTGSSNSGGNAGDTGNSGSSNAGGNSGSSNAGGTGNSAGHAGGGKGDAQASAGTG